MPTLMWCIGGAGFFVVHKFVLLVDVIWQRRQGVTGAISVSTYVLTWKLEFYIYFELSIYLSKCISYPIPFYQWVLSYKVFVIMMQLWLDGVELLSLSMGTFLEVFVLKCKLIFCSFEPYSLVDSIYAFHLNTCTYSA